MEVMDGMNVEMFSRLRKKAASVETSQVDRLRAVDTPSLPPLERQEVVTENGEVVDTFGSVSQAEASRMAAISKATGAEIYLVGSSVADPDKILEARARYGDTIKDASGNVIPRPVSDFDFLIRPSSDTKKAYDQVSAMLQKHILDERVSGNETRADYMLMTPGRDFDPDKPVLKFAGGKVTDFSPGTEVYYTPRGGGVKQVQTLAPTSR